MGWLIRKKKVLGASLAIMTFAMVLFAPLSIAFAQSTDITGIVTTGLDGGAPIQETKCNLTSPIECMKAAWQAATDFVGDFLWAIPKFVGRIIRAIGGVFMSFGSWLLDVAIDMSIRQPLDRFTGIQVGWQVMRDFANLFFIFIILYIAIKTILQLGDHNTKQMLVRVIVVALLINFSSFFTKVVIDAGNIVAVGFYNRILTSDVPRTNDASCSAGPNGQPSTCSLSKRFMSAMDMNRQTPDGEDFGPVQIMMIYMLTGLMYFLTGAVFIKGAYYFIARMIAFCFLIMFSPIAFLSYAFPSGRGAKFMGEWWSKLLNYTLLAPFYMIIIYLVLQIITQPGFLAGGTNTANVMDFILVIGLLYAGTNLAFSFASGSGAAVANWASKATSGAALGVMTGSAAYGARQTIGRYSARRADNEQLKADAQKGGIKGGFARFRLGAYEKGAKGSWDVSQSKYGEMGVGALGAGKPILQREGGFKKSGSIEHMIANRGKVTKTQEEDYVKKAKELFPEDPIAQQNYLRNNMGFQGYKKDAAGNNLLDSKGNKIKNDNFDTTKNKDAKDIKGKAASEAFKKAESKKLEDHINDLETSGAWTKADDKDLQDAIENNDATKTAQLRAKLDTAMSAAGKTAGKTIGDEMKDAMKKLGSRFVSELGESTLGSSLVASHLTNTDLKQMHRNDMDGKYGDKTLMGRVGKSVVGSGKNPSGTEYLASPEGRKDLFNYGVPRREVSKTKVYAKNSRLRKKLKRDILDIQYDIGITPPPSTLAEKEALQKLEDRLEKKQEELAKREEDTRTMLS